MLYSYMLKILTLLLISSSLYSCDKAQSVEVDSRISLLRPVDKSNIVKEGEVQRGQGLYQALKSVSIENAQALKLINELRDEVEFSKIKVGDKLRATYDYNQNLIAFTFSQNPVESHTVTLNEESGKWDYSLTTLDTFWKPRTIEGKLQPGSTLEEDLVAKGLDRSVVSEVVNVLLCKVNFRMHARKGDRYKVLVSERMYKDQVVGTKVLFTSYEGKRAGSHQSYYYEDAEKGSTYTAHYTEDGQALINSGLRYPLSRLHVRSSYGWRRHPVTGRRAMHRGVDLRGRNGDRVHAVASGKVVISNFPKNNAQRLALIQVLRLLIPVASRQLLTFTTNTASLDYALPNVTFSESDQDTQALRFDWQNPQLEEFSHPYTKQVLLAWDDDVIALVKLIKRFDEIADALSITAETTLSSMLTTIANRQENDARAMRGDSVVLDDILLALNDTVPMSLDLKTAYMTLLLENNFQSRDTQTAKIIADELDENTSLDNSLTPFFNTAIEEQPDAVYAFVRKHLSDAEDEIDEKWLKRLHKSAKASVKIAIESQSAETIRSWLRLIAREPLRYGLSDILHDGILYKEC